MLAVNPASLTRAAASRSLTRGLTAARASGVAHLWASTGQSAPSGRTPASKPMKPAAVINLNRYRIDPLTITSPYEPGHDADGYVAQRRGGATSVGRPTFYAKRPPHRKGPHAVMAGLVPAIHEGAARRLKPSAPRTGLAIRAFAGVTQDGGARQAASRRRSSVSNAKRNCAASSSGSQFVICGKTARQVRVRRASHGKVSAARILASTPSSSARSSSGSAR